MLQDSRLHAGCSCQCLTHCTSPDFPPNTRTHRYLIQPGSYTLSATLVYGTPICYLGAGPNRSSVVIAAGQGLFTGPGLPVKRMFLHNGLPSTSDTITLSRLVIDAANNSPGINGPSVVMEDVQMTRGRIAGVLVGDYDGSGLYVGSITAVNCTFTNNLNSGGTGGAVYVQPGGVANFHQVRGCFVPVW